MSIARESAAPPLFGTSNANTRTLREIRADSKIKSAPSSERCHLRFTNATHCHINLIWISFDKQEMQYGLIGPKEFIEVDTFKHHPWVAVDRHTGHLMLIEGADVFQPFTSTEYVKMRWGRTLDPNLPGVRITVRITYPMFSLKQHSLFVVKKTLKSVSDVGKLELPRNLANDLRLLFDRIS